MTDKIIELSKKYYNKLVDIRQVIHMNPELGFEEHKTAELISSVLGAHGIEHERHIAKTGIVGIVRGKYPGKTVLLRADMDALEIQEETNLPYESQVPNIMHACGHDGHVAGLIGAGLILNALKEDLHGNVKLVFQPAEESVGGAKPMIEEGILDNPKVDIAFACHLWGGTPEGAVHLKKGPIMAAPDEFSFKIQGVGGHGGMPHLSIDPIMIASQAITMFQTIVSRTINPLDSVVISIGSIHSGKAHNVIPDTVEVTGTVRSFSEENRYRIPYEMENILKSLTAFNGASYTYDFERTFPPLINNDFASDYFGEAFKKVVGSECVRFDAEPSMGGEDFSFISQLVPSAYAFVGISKDMKSPVKHHNPKFEWDDKNLLTLAQGMAQVAYDYLIQESKEV